MPGRAGRGIGRDLGLVSLSARAHEFNSISGRSKFGRLAYRFLFILLASERLVIYLLAAQEQVTPDDVERTMRLPLRDRYPGQASVNSVDKALHRIEAGVVVLASVSKFETAWLAFR